MLIPCLSPLLDFYPPPPSQLPPLRPHHSLPKSNHLDLDPALPPASGDSFLFYVTVDLSSVPDLAVSYTVAIQYIQIRIPSAEKLSFLTIASTPENAVKRGGVRVLGSSSKLDFQPKIVKAAETFRCKRALMENLRARGYNAKLSKANWESSDGLITSNYEYIDIVDLDFAAQFEVARATAEYEELVAMLPRVMAAREVEMKPKREV